MMNDAIGTLTRIQDAENLPWDPDSTQFPSLKQLPRIPGAPEGAAWVWGKDDFVSNPQLSKRRPRSKNKSVQSHFFCFSHKIATARKTKSIDSSESEDCDC